jgi:hypothetical protein
VGTARRTLVELNYQRPVYRNYRLLSNGSLLIEHASEEDEAKYMCEADNGVNEPLVKTVALKINGETRDQNRGILNKIFASIYFSHLHKCFLIYTHDAG